MKSGSFYRWIDPDKNPAPSCSQKVWEYIEYTHYFPGDLLRGNLWIDHKIPHYYHKIEVFGDGKLSYYGRSVGTVDDIQEVEHG